VLKIRSSTCGKVVYSSRMNPSNADPVVFKTARYSVPSTGETERAIDPRGR
jgi:hypothetical protein